MTSESQESTEAKSVGVCSDTLTMVREQTFRPAAAVLPTSGSSVPLQSGASVVQLAASENRSENEKVAMVSQLSRGRAGSRTGQLHSCCVFLVWFVQDKKSEKRVLLALFAFGPLFN